MARRARFCDSDNFNGFAFHYEIINTEAADNDHDDDELCFTIHDCCCVESIFVQCWMCFVGKPRQLYTLDETQWFEAETIVRQFYSGYLRANSKLHHLRYTINPDGGNAICNQPQPFSARPFIQNV